MGTVRVHAHGGFWGLGGEVLGELDWEVRVLYRSGLGVQRCCRCSYTPECQGYPCQCLWNALVHRTTPACIRSAQSSCRHRSSIPTSARGWLRTALLSPSPAFNSGTRSEGLILRPHSRISAEQERSRDYIFESILNVFSYRSRLPDTQRVSRPLSMGTVLVSGGWDPYPIFFLFRRRHALCWQKLRLSRRPVKTNRAVELSNS